MSDGFAVEGVTKHYDGVTALSGVSVDVEVGSFHGLVGPNGSGKTTLFHLLSGLARPTGGRVRRPPVPVGVGFQVPRFYPDLTVRENLSVFRSFAADSPPADWTETLLEELRLDPAAHRKPPERSLAFRWAAGSSRSSSSSVSVQSADGGSAANERNTERFSRTVRSG